jgi:hypothetical protein
MRSKALLLTVTMAALVASCSGSGKPTASSTPSPTPSATPSPTPSPTLAPSGNPLTGLAPVPGPVVAIKVDNGGLARPYQRGLRQAAVVYQELVEGGLTRFMAVFESATATSEVGPVRSGRESDIDILRGYGRASLAFSGAQPGVLALIRAAARAGYVIDASYDTAPSLYRLGERRRDARNFFTVPSRVGQRRGGSEPRDIGFRFGVEPGGVPVAVATVSFSPMSRMTVRYNATSGTYVISQSGRAVPVSPVNIIVQEVRTHPSRFHDVHHMNTPLTISTGTGTTWVMHNGKRFAGTWRRTGYGATHFVDATGKDILLSPGPTWVFLLPVSGSISFA